MAADETGKGKLPGNQGQFGENNATEAYKPLEKHPAPEGAPEGVKEGATPDQPPGSDAGVQHQTNAGERS